MNKLNFLKEFPKMNMNVTNEMYSGKINLPRGLDVKLKT